MKAIADKCHLLLSTKEKLTANVSDFKIASSNKEKLLGVTIDNHLQFESHIESFCSKASQKLYELSRISSYMSLDQHKLILKFSLTLSLVMSINMDNRNRELNNKINRIHEQALRIVYRDKKSTFNENLEKDNSVKIHIKNIHVLVTEMFEVQKETSPAIMSKVFPITEQNYILRNNSNFVSHRANTIYYGSESLSHLGPKLWRILRDGYKKLSSLNEFKSKIKT